MTPSHFEKSLSLFVCLRQLCKIEGLSELCVKNAFRQWNNIFGNQNVKNLYKEKKIRRQRGRARK